MKQIEYSFWLGNLKNIGPRKIEMLLKAFGNAKEVFGASKKALLELKEGCLTESGVNLFDEQDVEELLSDRNMQKVHESFMRLENSGVLFITKEEERYPEKLRQIYAAPYALYVKGSLPSADAKCLAVVGARDCSQYGMEMARYLAGAAAKEGIAVISGLARGIDSYAHAGALAAGGTTYGIMGCGIDICYPKENIELYTRMQKEGGIISEYPPGIKPLPNNFPMRNRIISGLSDAVLVIEARVKSGSLITADMGLEQGKDIYALPGKATDSLSEGCNNLIKMGAKMVTSPKDFLEDLLPQYTDFGDPSGRSAIQLNAQEEKIFSCLGAEPKHIEELSVLSQLPLDLLMEQLLLLELRGLVRQSVKNFYYRPM